MRSGVSGAVRRVLGWRIRMRRGWSTKIKAMWKHDYLRDLVPALGKIRDGFIKEQRSTEVCSSRSGSNPV
jgi:hypothetical protein